MASEFIIRIVLYLVLFPVAMYCISGIKFEQFMYVTSPNKVRILAVLLAMGLSYLSAEFLLGLMVFAL